MGQRGIGCLPDVALGYGTPQIQQILGSLGRYYGNRLPILVCEPDSPVYPAVHHFFTELSFHRVHPSSRPPQNPWWYLDGGHGQQEFSLGFKKWLQCHRPSLLVVTSSCLRLLDADTLRAGGSPHVIFYALEYRSKGQMSPAAARDYLEGLKSVRLILFSEKLRQYFHNREFQTQSVPQCHLYNAPPRNLFPTMPADKRNGRIIVQSITIMWGRTYPEYLLCAQRPDIPVDVYGNAFGAQAGLLRSGDIFPAFNVRYLGNVPLDDLIQARASYSFSFVSWKPVDVGSAYVSPCKFYESIASGVPPISAPHPECMDVIRRYDCGILMRDWSFTAFCDALESALLIRGTARYRELVRNCLHAHRKELNWEAQFAKVTPFLPNNLVPRTSPRRLPKLIIVKPGLMDDDAPEWEAVVNLLLAAPAAGLQPVAVVNRLLAQPLPETVSVHPVFWHDATGRDPASRDSRVDPLAGQRFIQDLEMALTRERAGRDDHVWLDETPPDS